MGTQQILLIVLSVIIVGAAIAVGIQMFNSQAYSANKSAIAADAQSYATQVVQYYKTPASQGGAGSVIAANEEAKIGNFLGWGGATLAAADGTSGSYKVLSTSATAVVIVGRGTEEKNDKVPAIMTTVAFPACTITAVAKDIAKTVTLETLAASNFDN